MTPKQMVTLPRAEFEDLLEQAACRGARKALKEVGLDDEQAAQDIRSLREFIGALNTAGSVALRTFIRWLVIGLLGLLLAGIAAKTGWHLSNNSGG